MVHKSRFVIFIILFLILIFLALTLKGNVETNLLRTMLPQKIINSTYIVPLADRTASDIKVIFEVNNSGNNRINQLKEDFIQNLDRNYFEIKEYKTKELVREYLKAPNNFLSPEVRRLIKQKKYDELFEKRFLSLLEPAGIQLSPLDKDPYLLLDDFLLSNRHEAIGTSETDNKIYDYITLRIKNQEGLSPDLTNKKIRELVKLQENLSDSEHKIYLAGNPVHSYYTSTQSIISINIICILSVLLIIFLTYYFFRTLFLLIPISLALAGGMFAGYIATKLWFADFQIITMVFSTTLIGVGIDYSYHYFFSKEKDNSKTFIKNITNSLLSTVIPFILLYFTGIELLKQISVFSSVGLISIYLTVIFIYPVFKKYEPKTIIKIPNIKFVKKFMFCIFLLALLGFLRFEFNDTLSAFYTPSKKLSEAENLYNKVSGNNFKDSQYIIVQGNNLNEIIENEELITSKLDENKTEYTSLSSFIPSVIRQKENFILTQDLYKNNLHKYSDILTPNQIHNLRTQKFIPVEPNVLLKDCFREYMPDDNTSAIIVFSDKKLDYENVVNIKSDIKKYLREYRKILMKTFIPVFVVLWLILSLSYGYKIGTKMLIPPICGIFCGTGLTLLTLGELNVFTIIALYMVLGFTIDYSIFRTTGNKQTENAILLSCATTSFAFLLLSVSGFKLLSTMSTILFFGIITSYLTGFILFKKDTDSMVN